MTFRKLFLAILLIASAGTRADGLELVFTGSFWKTADSYRLKIDFDTSPARLEWDGYPNNDYDRKPGAKGRVQFSFELTDAETALLQSLKKGLPLCHNGHNFAIGTGMSNTVAIWDEDEEQVYQHYFVIDPSAFLGKRMAVIPLSFQEKAGRFGLSAKKRSQWFTEIADLTSDLQLYAEALDTLKSAQKEESEPPWQELIAKSYRAQTGREPDDFPGESAFAYEAKPILDLLLSPENRSQYFPELGTDRVLVRIDIIANKKANRWQTAFAPLDLGDGATQWSLAPTTYLRLISDFHGLRGEYGFVKQHGLLDLIEPRDHQIREFDKRLNYIESSDWADALFPNYPEETDHKQLRIFEFTFEKNMSRCVILTRLGDQPQYTLFQVEDAQWKLLRQIDYRNRKLDPFEDPVFW